MSPQLPRISRRSFSLAAAGGALLASAGAIAQPHAWPSRPVRLVVAFPPGGLADVMARSLQPQLSEALGQPVVIDNRGGAAGNVAGSEVVRAGADQHTFLVTVSTTESVNPSMFSRMPFDVQKDLQPVGLLANSQLFLIVRPTLPVTNLREFLNYARSKPNTLSYGSAGNGTTPHLAGELLKQSAGVTATHVPYRGAAPVIMDVMSGQIDFGFAPGTVFPTAKAGKLKVLAVASRKRTVSAPEVPTFTELGVKDVYADTLFGVYAPRSVPAEIVERLNREINTLLAQPAIQARWLELGAEAIALKPAEYKSMVQEETKLFTEIVKARGITVD